MLFDPGCTNCGCPAAGITCGLCTVPASNLTLTFVNNLLGTVSIPMVFNGTNEWITACSNQLRYRMSCVSSTLTFLATYYVNGTCPTGQNISCTNPGTSPLSLNLSIYQCSPLLLRWTTAGGCPSLQSLGYSSFTVTV